MNKDVLPTADAPTIWKKKKREGRDTKHNTTKATKRNKRRHESEQSQIHVVVATTIGTPR